MRRARRARSRAAPCRTPRRRAARRAERRAAGRRNAARARRGGDRGLAIRRARARSRRCDSRFRLQRIEFAPLRAHRHHLLPLAHPGPPLGAAPSSARSKATAWWRARSRTTSTRCSRARPMPGGGGAQYALAKLNLPQAHTLATGKDVRVAVIDFAVDLASPELAGSIAGHFDTLKSPRKAHAARHADRRADRRPRQAHGRGARRQDPGGARLRSRRARGARQHLQHPQGPRLGGAAARAHRQYELRWPTRSGAHRALEAVDHRKASC